MWQARNPIAIKKKKLLLKLESNNRVKLFWNEPKGVRFIIFHYVLFSKHLFKVRSEDPTHSLKHQGYSRAVKETKIHYGLSSGNPTWAHQHAVSHTCQGGHLPTHNSEESKESGSPYATRWVALRSSLADPLSFGAQGLWLHRAIVS